jgi:hypothetical protein
MTDLHAHLLSLVDQSTPEGRALTVVLNRHTRQSEYHPVFPELYGEDRCRICAYKGVTPSQVVNGAHIHEEYDFCLNCRNESGDYDSWPCPTVLDIAQAFNVETANADH